MKTMNKIMRGFPAGLLCAVLLIVNISSTVMAAEFSVSDSQALTETPAMEEAVLTDEIYDIDSEIVDEALSSDTGSVEPEGAAPTTGSGTNADPYLIDLNTLYSDSISGAKSVYFCFTIENTGLLNPYASVTGCTGTSSNWFKIYKDSYVESSHIYESSSVKKSDLEKKEWIGLAPGKYILEFHLGEANSYSIKLDFTKSERYEEELDAPNKPKLIKTDGDFYYGNTSPGGNDPQDYYYFTLNKKSNISLYAKSDDNYYLSVGIYSNPDYSGKIADATYNNEHWIRKTLKAGTYYVSISNGLSATHHMGYKFFIMNGKSSSKEKEIETGTATVNGEKVTSLKAAFAKMKEAKEYLILLETDMIGEKNLTIPKNPTKVTISGNGHVIQINGTKFLSKTDLELKDLTIKTVNKKNEPAKLTLTAKKNLAVLDKVSFNGITEKISVTNTLDLTGALSATTVTTGNMNIGNTGNLIIGKNEKVTVKKELNAADGAGIELTEGFNKPIVLKGNASGKVNLSGKALPNGTQILKSNQSKLNGETLKSVFDVKGITDNTVESYLYYASKGKACLFGESIVYNEKKYGLWKDAVTQMNSDVLSGKDTLSVNLIGNVNAAGPLTMPKKGYKSITVNGEGYNITFTKDIKLTGDTTISKKLTLTKVNKKGTKVPGKIIDGKGKYKYDGPTL